MGDALSVPFIVSWSHIFDDLFLNWLSTRVYISESKGPRLERNFRHCQKTKTWFFYFYYCSSVWHFCGARDADKLEALNKRILRFLLGDYSSPYKTLLTKVSSTSLCNKRIQNFLILLYEFVFQSFSYLYEEYVFTPVLFLWSSWQLHSFTK